MDDGVDGALVDEILRKGMRRCPVKMDVYCQW